jgi:hypothetical protein
VENMIPSTGKSESPKRENINPFEGGFLKGKLADERKERQVCCNYNEAETLQDTYGSQNCIGHVPGNDRMASK